LKRAAILHVELSTADREAAEKFYETLFGWEFTQYPTENYTAFEAGVITAVINTMEDAVGGAGHTIIYVESSDVQADLDKAERLGGEIIVPRTPIPNVGWLGMFTDPAGNTIGLMQIV
jgi:uncharacterized protein